MNKKDYVTKVIEAASTLLETNEEISAFDVHELLPEFSIMSVRKGLAAMSCRGLAFATYKWVRKDGVRVTTYSKKHTVRPSAKPKGMPEVIDYCYPYY